MKYFLCVLVAKGLAASEAHKHKPTCVLDKVVFLEHPVVSWPEQCTCSMCVHVGRLH